MKINRERINKAQELMREQGMVGIMIMTRDDYQYFFSETRVQPRAIIPAFGEPIFICFKADPESIGRRGYQSFLSRWGADVQCEQILPEII